MTETLPFPDLALQRQDASAIGVLTLFETALMAAEGKFHRHDARSAVGSSYVTFYNAEQYALLTIVLDQPKGMRSGRLSGLVLGLPEEGWTLAEKAGLPLLQPRLRTTYSFTYRPIRARDAETVVRAVQTAAGIVRP